MVTRGGRKHVPRSAQRYKKIIVHGHIAHLVAII